ncbi:MAG: sporulation protein YqfD [Butyricicoccus sp.]|nr:sporulation protein YqfD [Butyricicoccus sp.]
MLNRFVRWGRGSVSVRVRGSSMERFLNACARAGVRLHEVRRVDALELTCRLSIHDLRVLRHHMRRTGCRLHITGRQGAPFLLAKFLRRRVLVAGCVLLAGLWFVLGNFLWVIDLRIDPGLPRDAVIARLEELGVYTGAPIWTIEETMVRDLLINSFEEVGYATVARRGNAARVEVRARYVDPEMVDEAAHTGIAAARDGVITDLTVTGGEAIVKKGDTVEKGDLLISALVHPRTEEAQPYLSHGAGRVMARTWRIFTVTAPAEQPEKQYTGKTRSQYALIFGNKRINLYFGSGITGNTCDKIVEKYDLRLSETMVLPAALIRQTYRFYELVPVENTESRAQRMAEDTERRLRESIDGELLEFTWSREETAEGLTLRCTAACEEQIGTEVLDRAELPPAEEKPSP